MKVTVDFKNSIFTLKVNGFYTIMKIAHLVGDRNYSVVNEETDVFILLAECHPKSSGLVYCFFIVQFQVFI